MFIEEPCHKTKIAEIADIVVCGGGPAGICAAIAAARMGYSTRLIESSGCLGGIWTSGLMSYVIDYAGKQGILREILNRLDEMGAKGPKYTFDIEAVKFLLESMCLESGVKIRFHSKITAALKNSENRVSHVITESKSGREAWQAKIFIDCTGDGDLAALAGCGFDVGRKENGEVQPMSMSALVYGLDSDKIQDFLTGENRKANLLKKLEDNGISPSYTQPTLFEIYNDTFLMMSNHEYGISAFDADAVTNATISGRAEIYRQVKALRASGGDWKNLRLAATSSHIGVREARRIHGHYTVTLDDLLQGKKPHDSVCTVTFGIDVHSTNQNRGGGYDNQGYAVKPYGIPLRALIARDVDALMMAGRCISGDFHAHASYRVTGNAAAMGEAVGIAAALSVKNDSLPQNLQWEEISKELKISEGGRR
ncbi:MAG: hypothetical protein A2020_04705 [Lentisphaerae bacterium GWF2_45_14]|nr:MAG: hypothetical protein A2020_04705 [Lentisphaerae bacterium GWF2_45_14]